jgi:hypothetical protein
MANQKIIYKKLLQIVPILLFANVLISQKIVHYDLFVKDTLVNFSGKSKTSHCCQPDRFLCRH